MASTIARRLRANATDAEIRLWSRLRRKQLAGFRFRRQQPVGPYVVNFCCLSARLIIEVDGGQHADSVRNERRTAWLETKGFPMIRFWNHDVLSNTEGVLLAIEEALSVRPPPGCTPQGAQPTSPARGEGRR